MSGFKLFVDQIPKDPYAPPHTGIYRIRVQYDYVNAPPSIIDSKTKEFEVEVGTPPATSLILKELGAEKGSGAPSTHKIGNLTIDQVVKVAKMKYDNLLGKELKQKTKEIIGTCVSLGVNVEGNLPQKIQKAIDEGEYDSKFV